ncbi:hypothetical protein EDB87DRAFT_1695353 [Lactarius vividus]|nr:hypothetical protein EDB87DRAFT_1695353 [Lactarius vividus]
MSGLNSQYSSSFFNDDYNHLYGNSSQFDHMLSNPPQHVDPFSSLSGPFSSSAFKAITCASHDILIRSGNTAYASMHTQFLQAKSSRAMPVTPQTITRDSDAKLETLIIPNVPNILEEDDFPDVPFWCESDWANHSERQKDRGKPIHKLGFLTDKEGDPVAESRIKDFMSHAKLAWNELYRHCLDPVSWTKKTLASATFFAHEMKIKFPEFCYCDGNWKAEQFAITKYPDWCRDVRELGRLTRIRPFKHKINEDSRKKEDRKRKRAKTKAVPPPGVQVIDLDDPPAGSTPTDLTPPTTGISATTIQHAASPAPTEPVPLRPLTPPETSPTLTESASLFHSTPQDCGASPASTELVAPHPSTPQDTSMLSERSKPAPPCPPTLEGAPFVPTEAATLRSPIQSQLDLPAASTSPATPTPALICPTQPSSNSPTPPSVSLASEATSTPHTRPHTNDITPQSSGAAGE